MAALSCPSGANTPPRPANLGHNDVGLFQRPPHKCLHVYLGLPNTLHGPWAEVFAAGGLKKPT